MQQEPDPPPALPAAGPREFAHKLNNLLTVVLAHAEASLSSKDPEEMRHSLEIIVQASTSMAEVVRSFARSSSSATLRSRDGERVENP